MNDFHTVNVSNNFVIVSEVDREYDAFNFGVVRRPGALNCVPSCLIVSCGCRFVDMSALYRGFIRAADKVVPHKYQPLWNHPAGKNRIKCRVAGRSIYQC